MTERANVGKAKPYFYRSQAAGSSGGRREILPSDRTESLADDLAAVYDGDESMGVIAAHKAAQMLGLAAGKHRHQHPFFPMPG